MFGQAKRDSLDILLAIEVRHGGSASSESPDVQEMIGKIMEGLKRQTDHYCKQGHFRPGQNEYMPYKPMLDVQLEFSNEHYRLGIRDVGEYEKIIPEIRKMIALLEKVRLFTEEEEERKLAYDYFLRLHRRLCAERSQRDQEMEERRRRQRRRQYV